MNPTDYDRLTAALETAHQADSDGAAFRQMVTAVNDLLERREDPVPKPVTPLLFVDVETTGLDPDNHEVWEIAYATETSLVLSSIVRHSDQNISGEAAKVNRYYERVTDWSSGISGSFERRFKRDLVGATIVTANTPFDTAMLTKRYGGQLWHYRCIDIESYAMPLLGFARPPSFLQIVEALNADYDARIPLPDHTATGDVTALREAFMFLRDIAHPYR